MKQPILYVFAISHYCEKARWALDRSGIDYKIKFLAPGIHMQSAKKMGLKKSGLPIMMVNGETIQGSAAIIDWVDKNTVDQTLNLTPIPKSKQFEKRLDDKLGIHIRRYYYSEAMVDYPETVKPIFKRGIPLHHKLLVDSIWPKVRRLMIKSMDLGPEQHLQSKAILEVELDWLDSLLSDGRSFLAGDQFSRADLAAASLLSPLVTPPNHPTYSDFTLTPRVAKDAETWKDRPVLKWVGQMYETHR